jgi:hypothetical protein
MKLPFTFSLKFAFRLLLPGFICSIGLLPSLQLLAEKLNLIIPISQIFIASMIISGWIFVFLDIPIYMIFEGRRYWPKWIWKLFKYSEERRLDRLLKNYERYKKKDHRKYVELSAEIRKFPIDENGDFKAFYPTRLGNILAAYEGYPFRIYGMDSIFFWYRIWLKIDDKLREHIDNQQALADSTLYVSASLVVSGTLSMIYGILIISGIHWQNLPAVKMLFGISIFAFLFSFIIYRLSLHLHVQFGEFFKSLFDTYKDEVSIDDVINDVATIIKDESIKSLSKKEKNKIAWRYLHNYKIKTANGNIAPPKIMVKRQNL